MMHTLQKLQYLHTYDWSIGRTDEDEISSEFLPDVLRGSWPRHCIRHELCWIRRGEVYYVICSTSYSACMYIYVYLLISMLCVDIGTYIVYIL